MADERLVFDADVDGVRDLMPHRLIDAQSTPSEADVLGYLDSIAVKVIAKLGHPDGWPDAYRLGGRLGLRAELSAAAGDVVELGAGARTQDAAFPDEVGRLGDRRYAAELWRQYEAGVADLERRLEANGYTVDPSNDAAAGAAVPQAPVYTMPATPMMTRGVRW